MKSRRKKYVIVSAICIAALLFGIRYITLNKQYPNPKILQAHEGEKLTADGLSFCLQKTELLDGKELGKLVPDIMIAADKEGKELPDDRVRAALFYVHIKNSSDKNMRLDFSGIGAESGAWGNGLDAELFMALNQGISVQGEQIKKKEEKDIILSFSMIDTMFKKHDWENIDKRVFSAVLSLYPEKLVLTGK